MYHYIDILIEYINYTAPRVKWGVQEAIGNLAKKYPVEVAKAVPGLLKNTEVTDKNNTVVRWCAAYGLTEILINNKEIPYHTELKVDALNYALGLADVVGELRRYVLDNIRNSKVEDIDEILEKMDEIYSHLFSLDYPSGLTKDLRHKTDTARNLIEKTRADVSLSVQMNTLSSLLKNKNEEK